MKFKLLALLCSIFACSTVTLAQPNDALESAFEADLYPSERTAIVRLTEQLVQELREGGAPEPTSVNIVHDADESRRASLLAPLSDTLRRSFPKVRIDSDGASPGDGLRFLISERDVREAVEAQAATSRTKAVAAQARSGRITIQVSGQVSGGAATVQKSAQFVEKPWADDWAMFVNSHPSNTVYWINGQSTSPGTTKDEAVVSARKSALRPLATRVLAEMNARAARAGHNIIPVSRQWVDERVMQSLLRPRNDGLLVKDTFVQKFSRPYGDVWQASVLIDASPKIVGDLIDSYNATAQAQFGRKALSWTAMGGMAVMILLVYGFLNVVTKGYFMWRLRAVALLAAIAGVLIIFAANR